MRVFRRDLNQRYYLKFGGIFLLIDDPKQIDPRRANGSSYCFKVSRSLDGAIWYLELLKPLDIVLFKRVK
jgi:hypothetical protein